MAIVLQKIFIFISEYKLSYDIFFFQFYIIRGTLYIEAIYHHSWKKKCGEEQGIIHMKMICKEIRFDWGFFFQNYFIKR